MTQNKCNLCKKLLNEEIYGGFCFKCTISTCKDCQKSCNRCFNVFCKEHVKKHVKWLNSIKYEVILCKGCFDFCNDYL